MRLTNAKRSLIANALVKEKFKAKDEKLENESYELANEIRLYVIEGKEELLQSLPSNWCVEENSFSLKGISYADAHTLWFDKQHKGRRFPKNFYDIYISNITDKKLEKKAQNWKDKKDAVIKESRELEQKIYATLCSFNTTKTLLKEFPELTVTLQKLNFEKIQLPAKKNFSEVHELLKTIKLK